MADLLIVESPAKAKTIEKYLGKGYKVLSTMGHVRDLPKSKTGVDTENDYAQDYVTIKGKGALISKIKKSLPDGGTVYLAQDLDREGEAIAWHVGVALGLIDEDGKSKKIRGKKVDHKRITFDEITKSAIQNAIKKPRDIDMNLVEAQQARRVLDRLVGYELSPLLWKKIRYGLSGGRVQSVAVRLIVDRERERDAFEATEYWELTVNTKTTNDTILPFDIKSYKGDSFMVNSEKYARDHIGRIEKSGFVKILDVETKEIKKNPPAPFRTSTLQQSAYNKYKFSTKKTMSIAQRLYQGVEIGDRGLVGLITYMRTDSTNMSEEAIGNVRAYISNNYSAEYLEKDARHYKTTSRGAQEAHECIRPTDITITPKVAAGFLDKDDLRLYSLLWNRTVATQMSQAVYSRLTILGESGDYLLSNSSQNLVFPGYQILYSAVIAEQENVNVKKGDSLSIDNIDASQHFTQPPARYNEASLVKTLEKYGIGRPSTYSSIISTIQARGYVEKKSGSFEPTDTGFVVNDLLVKHFPEIVDYNFTAEMEEDLDEIALGKKEWVPIIDAFYKPFHSLIEKKEKSIDKEDVVVLGESDEVCDKCGASMIVKLGKYGRFLSCSKFPDCKGMKSISEEIDEKFKEKYLIPKKCEECKGQMILKTGKYGKFWACENYPDCKHIVGLLLNEKCPECGENLVERKGKWGRSFTGCSGYPDCKYIKKEIKKKKEDGEEEEA